MNGLRGNMAGSEKWLQARAARFCDDYSRKFVHCQNRLESWLRACASRRENGVVCPAFGEFC